MAVTKLWSVTERLGQVIDYATNPEKTSANIKREFSPEQYQALADVIAYAKDEAVRLSDDEGKGRYADTLLGCKRSH